MKKLIFLTIIALIFIGFNSVSAEKEKINIGNYINSESQDKDFIKEAEETIIENAKDIDFKKDKKSKYFLNKNLEFQKFRLKNESENIEIWINESILPNKSTNEQIDKLIMNFDSKIYPEITDFFGKPDFHDGTNSRLEDKLAIDKDYYYDKNGKILILIDNLDKDTNGYYSNIIEDYTDRNIITVNKNILKKKGSKIYFNSIAHELQHLIHSDNDKNEEVWLDEMMSYHAESLVSKKIYVNDNDEESKKAYLLRNYLYDNYGDSFLRTLARDKDNGSKSLDKILRGFGKSTDSDEIFRKINMIMD